MVWVKERKVIFNKTHEVKGKNEGVTLRDILYKILQLTGISIIIY